MGRNAVDMLVLAAANLHESGKGAFTAEDLVVAVWKMFPETFGLRGYVDESNRPLYPDSNRVYMEIMGTKPIRKRGFLTKTGEKTYRLTEAGQSHAKVIGGLVVLQGVDRKTMPRDLEATFDRLVRSSATGKYSSGSQEEITFYDACIFWGISPRSDAKQLWERLARVKDVIAQAEKAYAGTARAKAVARIQALDELLRGRFASELAILEKRVDERR